MALERCYCTLRQAEDYLKVNQSAVPTSLELIITAVSRSIDEHCHRSFFTDGTTEDPVVREFVAEFHDEVWIDDLVSVVAVTIDDGGDGTFATELTSDAYRLMPVEAARSTPLKPYTSIRRTRGGRWPISCHEDPTVRISGVWGFPTGIPEQVTQASLIQVARLAARPKTPLGLAEGIGEFGGMRVFGKGWDQDALALLQPFVRYEGGFA